MVTFHDVKGQDGEMLFKTSCAACHSIGKGKLLGPDLMGITSKRSEEWLAKFIKSTKSMIEANDSVAIALVKEYNNFIMPEMPYNPAEIKAVINFLRKSGGGETVTSKPEEVPSLTGDAARGKGLFEGTIPFEAKGAACIACHRVDLPDAVEGGLFARNLTQSFTTLGSNAAVINILTYPPFPAMQIAYKDNSLTPQEVADVTSYLKNASEQSRNTDTSLLSLTFIFGILGAIFLIDFTGILWRKRKVYSVNRSIIERQTNKKLNKQNP